MADVEMKSAASETKPAEDKKEEDKKEEPSDLFYGKWIKLSLTYRYTWYRAEEIPCSAREGGQREGLQDGSLINQIIQKAQKALQSL